MRALDSSREFVASSSGWRRRILAVFLGALAVLALPPFHVLVVLIPSFVGLAWLIDSARGRADAAGKLGFLRSAPAAAFAVGWWFGMGFFIAGLYWMSYAFLVDSQQFAWLIPFAVPGLSAVAALYIGLVAWATFAVAKPGFPRVIVLPAAWVAAEWLRGVLLTGFPWNLLATVWTFSDSMIQSTALFGAYGLSLFTALAAAAPAALTDERTAVGRRRLFVGTAYALIAILWAGGALRLMDAPRMTVPDVRLRLVQPDIAQSNKWQPELRIEIMRLLIEMSAAPPRGAPPTHIIWPETATPEFLAEHPADVEVLSRYVPKGGALITGAPRIERRGPGDVTIWNALHVINDAGRIGATYDKVHLVPFGEYIPLPNWLGVRKLTAGRVDFTPGPGLATVAVPGTPPMSPLICYEGIFPAHVVAPDAPRPGWLLNVTNDAWFGISTGPYQHAATVRLRSVEEGLPLVRVANNGVSGVFDGYGRVTAYADLGQRAVVDADLPRALGPTAFSYVGNWAILTLLLIYVSVFPLFSGRWFRATLRLPTNQ